MKIKLKEVLKEKGITQKELSKATNIPATTISGYVTGASEPTGDNLHKICKILNIEITEEKKEVEIKNLDVKTAAELMGKSVDFVTKGLQTGVFDFGYAVKLTKWSYYISPIKFMEYTGIDLKEI